MLYQKPSFTVPATEGKGDCSHGHAMPDQRGKCVRCGDRIALMALPQPIGIEARSLPDGGYEVKNLG